jgi:glycine C-acetyltransferase
MPVRRGPEEVVDYIRFNARPNVFSRMLPSVYVEAIVAALELIERRGEELRDDLWKIATRLQEGLVDLGFDLGRTQSPVTPVYVRNKDEATFRAVIRGLREDGIFVSGVSHPAVPAGTLLIRMIPTSAHSLEDVDKTLVAFKRVRDRFKLAHSDPGAASSR